MADVPDDLIFRGVEHAVQRQGQLDHAQIGAEMAAVLGTRVDQNGPNFAGEYVDFRPRESL